MALSGAASQHPHVDVVVVLIFNISLRSHSGANIYIQHFCNALMNSISVYNKLYNNVCWYFYVTF